MTDVLAPKAVYLAAPMPDAHAVEAIMQQLDGLTFEAGFASQQVTCRHPTVSVCPAEASRTRPGRGLRVPESHSLVGAAKRAQLMWTSTLWTITC